MWTSTDDDERMDDSKIRKTTGLHKLPFEKKKKILGYTFQSAHKDAGQIGGKVAERGQGLVERRENLKKQRRTMESGMQKNCGTSLQCILFRERKLVLPWSDLGQNER